MRRRWMLAAGIAAALTSGCASGPTYDNSVFIGEAPPPTATNPAYIAMGPPDYATVFESVIDVLDDYFEIAQANRYDGRIRTFPRVAPGFEQPWRPGSPDGAERMLCTLQSMAYSCDVVIQPGETGGYQIFLTVNRYLEDLPRPIRATAGAAAFRSDNTVDRRFEVVDPSRPDVGWLPKGREPYLEQTLLKKIEDKLGKR
ncbi:MAG: hypothetical protein K1X57_15290 [Gemmataceae bacterium]|nr:hypothetical protein [Gemmataceae bacterium]